MKSTSFYAVLVAIILMAVFLSHQGITAASNENGKIPGQYIVVLLDDVQPSDAANDMAREHGLELRHVYSHALKGFAARVPSGRLQALEKDPRVAFVEPDRTVSITHHCKGAHSSEPKCAPTPVPTPTEPPPPADPPSSGQSVPLGILRINGDLSSTISGNGTGTVDVDVAVLDTGIDKNHPDLNVVGGHNCVNVYKKRDKQKYDDGHGHGSHVAGTIGALDNEIGVVGAAPGARLWAVRVLNNSGTGNWSDVICGIDWVTGKSDIIEVANMSLGGGCGMETIWKPMKCDDSACDSASLHQAICNSVNAGITYVVAAGNSSLDAQYQIPAAYEEVITVSGLADFDGVPGGQAAPSCSDEDDTFYNASNFGPAIDLIAPAVCIESTWRDGGYNTKTGTSMAAPHVAGAAALYKSINPNANPSQVKDAMIQAGDTWWGNQPNNAGDPDNYQEKLLDISGF